jgi:hypothetical protein
MTPPRGSASSSKRPPLPPPTARNYQEALSARIDWAFREVTPITKAVTKAIREATEKSATLKSKPVKNKPRKSAARKTAKRLTSRKRS